MTAREQTAAKVLDRIERSCYCAIGHMRRLVNNKVTSCDALRPRSVPMIAPRRRWRHELLAHCGPILVASCAP